MTTEPAISLRAERAEIERLISALEPLSGGIWLATDLTTHVHWTIRADHVNRVTGLLEGQACRAFGIVTVCDPDCIPVFLFNEGDTLDWLEPERVLAVRELGDAPSEIRLERLDDLDAQFICASSLVSRNAIEPLRTIAVNHDRYLQIYDDQLPTGNADADAALALIEATIEARRRLVGPAAGTLDVMRQMTAALDEALRAYPIHSFIWAAVLREQIASMRASLAA